LNSHPFLSLISIKRGNLYEYKKIKNFYATATSLNMTKVAKELYISQPSVSQAIHEFEEEIGARLFDRIGKEFT
jgi:DNA-binding transcriptional LysR family regulator